MDGRVFNDKCEDVRSSSGEAGPTTGPAGLSWKDLLDKNAQTRKLKLEDWFKEYQPSDLSDCILVELAATTMAKIHECWIGEQNARHAALGRAELGWETMRAEAAAKLCGRLATNPDVIKPLLEANLRATRWMVARWQDLIARLEDGLPWLEKHKNRALDLLGVPADFRDGRTPLVTAPGADVTSTYLAVARKEVKRLSHLIESELEPVDELERERMLDPYNPCQDREVLRILRIEQVLTRRVLWIVSKLRHLARSRRDNEPENFSVRPNPDTRPTKWSLRTTLDLPRTVPPIEPPTRCEPIRNDSLIDLFTYTEAPVDSAGQGWDQPEVHPATHAADEPWGHLPLIVEPTALRLELVDSPSEPPAPPPRAEDAPSDPNQTEGCVGELQDDQTVEDVSEPIDDGCEMLIPGGAPRWFCEEVFKQQNQYRDHVDQLIADARKRAYDEAMAAGVTPEEFEAFLRATTPPSPLPPEIDPDPPPEPCV